MRSLRIQFRFLKKKKKKKEALLNYISHERLYWLVVILHTKSRAMCDLTLPYVSRTRSFFAQYIKQDNDGRRTAGESQPGIVNKTA